jgi:DNA-binding NarL/FixJ family response regulator
MNRSAKPLAIGVMLVEDSEIVRTRLLEMLFEAGVADVVAVATDVAEASALFLATRPDVVILDLQLPSGCGLDVLETIRRTDLACVVMVLTSYNFPDLRRRCLDSGANHFLHKASEFERVTDLLRDLSEGRA